MIYKVIYKVINDASQTTEVSVETWKLLVDSILMLKLLILILLVDWNGSQTIEVSSNVNP